MHKFERSLSMNGKKGLAEKTRKILQGKWFVKMKQMSILNETCSSENEHPEDEIAARDSHIEVNTCHGRQRGLSVAVHQMSLLRIFREKEYFDQQYY